MDTAAMNLRLGASPFNAWLGLRAVHAQPGEVVIVMRWRAELCGRPAATDIHGGALASLLDVGGSYAVASQCGRPAITVDLRSDFHRAFVRGEARAHARLIGPAGAVLVAQIAVTDEAGVLLASGTGTYLTPTDALIT